MGVIPNDFVHGEVDGHCFNVIRFNISGVCKLFTCTHVRVLLRAFLDVL